MRNDVRCISVSGYPCIRGGIVHKSGDPPTPTQIIRPAFIIIRVNEPSKGNYTTFQHGTRSPSATHIDPGLGSPRTGPIPISVRGLRGQGRHPKRQGEPSQLCFRGHECIVGRQCSILRPKISSSLGGYLSSCNGCCDIQC